jgi:hypothetical protein
MPSLRASVMRSAPRCLGQRPQALDARCLRDPDGAGTHAEGPPGLLGREADGDAQEEELTQGLRERGEKLAGALRVGASHRGLLRSVGGLWLVRKLGVRDRRTVAGTLRIGHFVRRDPVDERLERAPLVPVPRQSRDHGDADLLSDVVRRVLRPREPGQSRTAVPTDQPVDDAQQPLGGQGIADDGAGRKCLEIVPLVVRL